MMMTPGDGMGGQTSVVEFRRTWMFLCRFWWLMAASGRGKPR